MTNNVKEHLKAFGYNPDANNSDETDDDTPPNYIMTCHECGHRLTRERACKTTKKAKTGEMTWKGCGHQIYFTRNAIDGLRDEDILEALQHLDATSTIEAEEFERLDVHVDHHDEQDEHLIDITYLGFSDEAELEEDETGHYPFNRGILATGYRKDDAGNRVLLEPEMGNMLKDVNQDLGSEDTPVQLLELSNDSW